VSAYLDTSAAVKLIVEEPESEPLALFLDRLLDAADAWTRCTSPPRCSSMPNRWSRTTRA